MVNKRVQNAVLGCNLKNDHKGYQPGIESWNFQSHPLILEKGEGLKQHSINHQGPIIESMLPV